MRNVMSGTARGAPFSVSMKKEANAKSYICAGVSVNDFKQVIIAG